MQLPKLNPNLKPLTLVVGLLSATSTFAYNDIDNYSKITTTTTNSRIANYINIVDKNDNEHFSLKFKFQNYFQNWEQNTVFLSSASAIVEDENFKAIVAMGLRAVPFIKEEIERKPSTLVWALNYIYGHKISNKQGITITEACKLWIKALS